MKFVAFTLCTLVLGATAAQADIINRRNQCARWEYIPASEALGSPETALLFCNEEDRTWLSLRIECRPDEKRLAITYQPGFPYDKPRNQTPAVTLGTEEVAAAPADPKEVIADFSAIPLEGDPVADDLKTTPKEVAKEMIFFDFRSFGYTSVAYFGGNDDWQFFEPEPLSPVFSRLITGNYADISLLATGTTERLPLRGSSKALRPLVESCRIAKRKG